MVGGQQVGALRLLAREVYLRVAARVGPERVALVTGEEKIKPKAPRFWVSTVEAMPRDLPVDFVAIDNYMPLSDWRDGFDHADALEGWPANHDRGYLQANIAGGEGFDWFQVFTADPARRDVTTVAARELGKALRASRALLTTLLPVGDGLLVSVRQT